MTELIAPTQASVDRVTNDVTKPVAGVARTPMDLDRAEVPQGVVHVIAERCKECNMCIVYCPAEVLVYSEDINAKGYHYPVIADGKSSACVFCKFCDLICPELAIYTTDADDADGG